MIEIIKENAGKNASPDHISAMMHKVIKFDKNITDVLTNFDLSDIKKNKEQFIFPIVLRTGGIGDLIALSSLCYWIPNELSPKSKNIKFISQEKYSAVFDWYKQPVTFISYFSPVVKYDSNNPVTKSSVNKKYKPIYFEGIIENSKENWFDLQYKVIGNDYFEEKFGRPILRTDRINNEPSNIDPSKKSVVINCRSTAIIRSMRFQDIYESLIECIGDSDVNIYTHNRNLRDFDIEFIEQLNDPRVKIITAKSLKQFFLDVYDATLSISVDTAQFHFREGIEKPAIGLYGPFPYECRTKYYKFTKSLNIKSQCPNMPCYIHVKQSDATCDFEQDLIKSGQYNKKFE